MRRHRSCFLLAAGAGLLLAFPLGLQAQTPQELKAYERRLQQLFEQLDRDGNRRLERQEVQGQPYLQRHFDRLVIAQAEQQQRRRGRCVSHRHRPLGTRRLQGLCGSGSAVEGGQAPSGPQQVAGHGGTQGSKAQTAHISWHGLVWRGC